MIKLCLLGFGTVGQGVFRILQEHKTLSERFAVSSILVRDTNKVREVHADPALLTDDKKEVFSDPAIDCFVELTGEVDGIKDDIVHALQNGKHVVTANKALISAALEELEEAADKGGASLRYEAAVAGAVPVVKAVTDLSRVHPANEIQGILNGTCNFILSRMEAGESYETALKEAQQLGFAEADPSADVDGYDTQRKLRILATLGFGASVTEEDIPCRGIAELEAADLAILKKYGRKVKLMGIAKRKDRRFTAQVCPVCVPHEDAFSQVDGSYNRVQIEADYPGTLSWTGPGAGMLPTAHAVWNDILDAFAHAPVSAPPRTSLVNANETAVNTYYLRAKKPVEKLFPDIPRRSLGDARIVGPVRADTWAEICSRLEEPRWALWIDEE